MSTRVIVEHDLKPMAFQTIRSTSAYLAPLVSIAGIGPVIRLSAFVDPARRDRRDHSVQIRMERAGASYDCDNRDYLGCATVAGKTWYLFQVWGE